MNPCADPADDPICPFERTPRPPTIQQHPGWWNDSRRTGFGRNSWMVWDGLLLTKEAARASVAKRLADGTVAARRPPTRCGQRINDPHGPHLGIGVAGKDNQVMRAACADNPATARQVCACAPDKTLSLPLVVVDAHEMHRGCGGFTE